GRLEKERALLAWLDLLHSARRHEKYLLHGVVRVFEGHSEAPEKPPDDDRVLLERSREARSAVSMLCAVGTHSPICAALGWRLGRRRRAGVRSARAAFWTRTSQAARGDRSRHPSRCATSRRASGR